MTVAEPEKGDRDRTEQVTLFVSLAFDGHGHVTELRRHVLEAGQASLFVGESRRAGALDLGHIALRDHHGHAVRQQEVTGVTRLHIDEVPGATEVLDVLLQQ